MAALDHVVTDAAGKLCFIECVVHRWVLLVGWISEYGIAAHIVGGRLGKTAGYSLAAPRASATCALCAGCPPGFKPLRIPLLLRSWAGVALCPSAPASGIVCQCHSIHGQALLATVAWSAS